MAPNSEMNQTSVSIDFAERRRLAAAQFTKLLESHTTFSYLRLNDGEIACIQDLRSGRPSHAYDYLPENGFVASIERPHMVAGLDSSRLPQLIKSFENCTFLDYCDSVPKVREALPSLNLRRSNDALRNEGPETSNIIFEWTHYELKGYLANHRCLFAGAESALLRELYADPAYRSLAAKHLPESAAIYFHQLRNNGKRYSENMELIREDLKQDIIKLKIDTLFLSMATGAKILCYEIAEEMGIRAIDFGSMPRALSYAGSSGYSTAREYHNPLLFRVPLQIYMRAFASANPESTLAERVAKAHAQLHLDLLDLKPFTFNNSDGVAGHSLQPSPDALSRFHESLKAYDSMFLPHIESDEVARGLHKEFRRWCLKKGIGWRGKLFSLGVLMKGTARKCFSFLFQRPKQAQ